MREPFILFQRAAGAKGGKTYYASFWDPDKADYIGRRSTAVLLAEISRPIVASPTSRAGARLIVETWLETHRPGRSRTGLAIDFLEEFWADDGVYATGRKARGKQLSEEYLYTSRLRITKYVRPFLARQGKPIHLDGLSAALLEELALELYELCASPSTANQVLAAVGKPLAEATRLGLIRDNPMRRVEKLAEEEYARTPLTREEAKAFFALPWSDPRLSAINLLAATTGMRLGECIGLLAEDLRPGGINLCHNWQPKEGLKGPKGSKGDRVKARLIPLPKSTEKTLTALVDLNPWKDGFVFWGDSKGRPIAKQYVEEGYNAALKALGIEDGKRKARGLGFHAWRHWFNSQLRGKVEDHVLRGLTGHATAEMTERYTEIFEEQRIAVAALAEGLV